MPLLRYPSRRARIPDPDHPLREWVDWYLKPDGTADRSKSGVVRYMAVCYGHQELVWGDTPEECAELAGRPVSEVLSFTFVPAVPDLDNPSFDASRIALAGPGFELRLRHGNWSVR